MLEHANHQQALESYLTASQIILNVDFAPNLASRTSAQGPRKLLLENGRSVLQALGVRASDSLLAAVGADLPLDLWSGSPADDRIDHWAVFVLLRDQEARAGVQLHASHAVLGEPDSRRRAGGLQPVYQPIAAVFGERAAPERPELPVRGAGTVRRPVQIVRRLRVVALQAAPVRVLLGDRAGAWGDRGLLEGGGVLGASIGDPEEGRKEEYVRLCRRRTRG